MLESLLNGHLGVSRMVRANPGGSKAQQGSRGTRVKLVCFKPWLPRWAAPFSFSSVRKASPASSSRTWRKDKKSASNLIQFHLVVPKLIDGHDNLPTWHEVHLELVRHLLKHPPQILLCAWFSQAIDYLIVHTSSQHVPWSRRCS